MTEPLRLKEPGTNDYVATGGSFWIEWGGWSVYVQPRPRGRILIEAYRKGQEGETAGEYVMTLPATGKRPIEEPITAGDLITRLCDLPRDAIVCVSLPDGHPEDRLVISKELETWDDGTRLDLFPVQS